MHMHMHMHMLMHMHVHAQVHAQVRARLCRHLGLGLRGRGALSLSAAADAAHSTTFLHTVGCGPRAVVAPAPSALRTQTVSRYTCFYKLQKPFSDTKEKRFGLE